MAHIKIAPSLLAADFSCLATEINAIETQGCDWVHLDVMDGHFVPNLTFGPPVCKALRPHIKTVMDAHLMIHPVDPFIKTFVDAGVDVLTVHLESSPHIHRSLQSIRSANIKAGLALSPGTPVELAAPLLDMCDLILVMTVNPGFGGQSFIHSQLTQITNLRKMIGQKNILIQVDGDINPDTAPLVAAAGANILVAGSAVFHRGSPDNPNRYGDNIRAIRNNAIDAL